MTNILVTGAAGHLGRRVVELLLETRPGHIIAASRDTAKLAARKSNAGQKIARNTRPPSSGKAGSMFTKTRIQLIQHVIFSAVNQPSFASISPWG